MGESFDFLVHVYEQRLHVIPLEKFFISKQLLIADSQLDISSLSNWNINEFFNNAIIKASTVIDATNLCLQMQNNYVWKVRTNSRVLLDYFNEKDLYVPKQGIFKYFFTSVIPEFLLWKLALLVIFLFFVNHKYNFKTPILLFKDVPNYESSLD